MCQYYSKKHRMGKVFVDSRVLSQEFALQSCRIMQSCGLKVFSGNKVGKIIFIYKSDALGSMGRENKNIHEWKKEKYN